MYKFLVSLEMLLTPVFWVLSVLGIVIAGALTKPVASRLNKPRATTFLAFCSLLAVFLLAVPLLYPQDFPEISAAWNWAAASTWFVNGWENVAVPDLGLEGLANLALFAFAGCFCARLVGRPFWVTVSLWAISFAVETVQAGLGSLRAADPRDLVNNMLGALVGVGITEALTKPRDATGAAFGRECWPRKRITKTLASVLTFSLGLAILHLFLNYAADLRQAHLLKIVRAAYAGTTISGLVADSKRLGNEQVVGRAGVWVDYLGPVGDQAAEARFRAEGTAYLRCVVIEWRGDASAIFLTPSGDICLEFRDVALGFGFPE